MNYIIFDLEATCVEDKTIPFQNEIIEIGAVKLNSQLEKVGEFTTFIKPIINPTLTDFCTRLTTITQSQVDEAGTFSEGLQAFLEFIGDEEYVLLSWGGYDKNQLTKDCELHSLQNGFLKQHYNLKKLHHEKILLKKDRQMGMKAALRNAGLKIVGTHHRGLDDAINIARILQKHQEELLPFIKVKS